MRLTLIAVLFLAACGSASSNATGSCDTRATNTACGEFVGPSDVVATYKAACAGNGTWKDARCDRTGTVGGCQNMDASLKLTYTNWFYAPTTAAVVMQDCRAPSVYVAQ
jgi:hypothetical protein